MLQSRPLSPSKRFARAFTIVELLVVVAIIGVLAGIILPATSYVRGQAGLNSCASNLHQLHLAMSLYAADYSGIIPPYASTHYVPASQKIFTLDQSSQLIAVMQPYTKSKDIWFCPADTLAHTASLEFAINHRYTSYKTTLWWFGLDYGNSPVLGATPIDISIWSRRAHRPFSTSEIEMMSDYLWD